MSSKSGISCYVSFLANFGLSEGRRSIKRKSLKLFLHFSSDIYFKFKKMIFFIVLPYIFKTDFQFLITLFILRYLIVFKFYKRDTAEDI